MFINFGIWPTRQADVYKKQVESKRRRSRSINLKPQKPSHLRSHSSVVPAELHHGLLSLEEAEAEEEHHEALRPPRPRARPPLLSKPRQQPPEAPLLHHPNLAASVRPRIPPLPPILLHSPPP